MNSYGTAVSWGLSDISGVTLSASLTNLLFQSAEVNEETQEELMRDAGGSVKAVAKYDVSRKATLEFIPTGGTAVATGGTITISSWPTAGGTITVTNTTFTPIAGAWIVDSWNWTRGNTKALMASVSLSKYIDNSVPA